MSPLPSPISPPPRRRRPLAAALLGLAAGIAAAIAASGALAAAAMPDFEPCELSGSSGVRVAAECATFAVPENPAEPAGVQIELFVARVRSLAPEPAADAVTLIQGGPGGSSVEMYADLAGAFQDLRRERDIVVVDQRGTGRSQALNCPPQPGLGIAAFDSTAMRDAASACLDALPGDPRFYTTSVAVTDLEALRQALGYSSWNLYGASYGTRVAQHYLARYPDHVRTLVLDGVVPPGLTIGPDIAPFAQQTLDAIFARCAASPYCAEAFPNLQAQLATLAERLRAEPVALRIADPLTGDDRDLELGYLHLALSLRLLSYAPESAAILPIIVQEAVANDNYLPLAAQAVLIEASLNDSLSGGMHNSVVCTEDVPHYPDLSARMPDMAATYLGTDIVRGLRTTCDVWPRGELHPALLEVVESPRPVLILSGELDPITPPAYGEQAAAGYPNGRHLVAPGQGHGIVARGCIPTLVADFVAEASVESLDAGCIDRLQGDAFFTTLLGPPP